MRWRVPLLAFTLFVAITPLPPARVERVYSQGLFPVLQPVLTSLSNLTPVAWFDLLLATVALAWLAYSLRDWRRGKRRWIRIATRTATWACVSYLAFLVAWGLNYRREPLTARLRFDAGAINADAAVRLLRADVDALNRLHDRAHELGWPAAGVVDPSLTAAFESAARTLGGSRPVVVARPKRTALEWYFRKTGVDGMTDPFFLETLVNSELLPFERPFVVAHEWGHLAGLADEGEANFAALLACLRGPASTQYSGWLSLYGDASQAVPPRARARIAAALGPGPRADLRAIRDRISGAVSPSVSSAGWRVYDSYLKANRVEAGTASYGEVVRLALGLTLPDGRLLAFATPAE